MDRFEIFVAKHGEEGAQAILENWEKFHGIRHLEVLSLERRWDVFIQETSAPLACAA